MAIPETALEKTKAEYGDYQLEGDKVVGKLNYISNFDAFESGAEGNFIALHVQEAQDGKNVTMKLTGTGASEKEKALDETGDIVVKIHNPNNKLTLTVEDNEPRIIDFSECILLKKHNDVLKIRQGTDKTFNQLVSALQKDVNCSADGKIAGTLLWNKEFQPEQEVIAGNWLAVHLEQSALPEGASEENVEMGIDTFQAPDPKDWNYTMRITEERHSKKLQVKYNGEVLYEYDLTGLTLKSESEAIKTKQKITKK